MSLTPIIAKITNTSDLTVQSYNDGNISFTGFLETNTPVLATACRRIMKTVGLIAGVYAARPYPMNIMSGNTIVFVVPSLYFGSRSTMTQDYSDIEIIKGRQFTGQAF